MYQWKVQEGKQGEKENKWERKPITTVQPKDAPYFKQISDKFKSITKFSDAPEPQDSNGTFAEWAYYHFGRWSFSVPAWWLPVIKDKPDSNETKKDKSPKPKKKAEEKDPLAKEKRLWKWIQATNQKDAFVQWKEISHPDFPDRKVEVGGFKPFIDINPPADSLQNLADKYNAFLMYLGSTLPKAKIKETKVEHLHDNVYRVQIYVSNEGYLPTNTEIGEISMWNPKVKVTIKLEQKQKIVSGKTSYLIDSISGSDSAKELSLLIVGDKGSKITISVGSPTAGEDEKVVILK
jgi:hypothetical protein